MAREWVRCYRMNILNVGWKVRIVNETQKNSPVLLLGRGRTWHLEPGRQTLRFRKVIKSLVLGVFCRFSRFYVLRC